jgi:hypothetical protein
VLAIVAAGCGGGGGGPRLTRSEFASRAEAICSRANAAAIIVDLGEVDPASPEASAADLQTFANGLDKVDHALDVWLTALRKLRPPQSFQGRYAAALDAAAASNSSYADAAKAARDGDKPAIVRSFRQAARHADQFNRTVTRYGLRACGTNSGLYIRSATGGQAKEIVIGCTESFAWSPDGKSLAVAHLARDDQPSDVTDIVTLRNGGTIRLAAAGRPEPPAWSPDGSQVAFGEGDSGVFVVPSSGGPPRRTSLSDTHPLGHRTGSCSRCPRSVRTATGSL